MNISILKVVDFEVRRKLRPQLPNSDREVIFLHEQEVVLPDSKDRYVVEFEVTTKVPPQGAKASSGDSTLCPDCCNGATVAAGLKQSNQVPDKPE